MVVAMRFFLEECRRCAGNSSFNSYDHRLGAAIVRPVSANLQFAIGRKTCFGQSNSFSSFSWSCLVVSYY